MADVILGCDSNNENDSNCQNIVHQTLQQAGHNVNNLGIDPNSFANYSYGSEAKGKVGVYLMAASLISFLDASDAGFDYNILGIRGDVTEHGTEQGFKTLGVPQDHDGNYSHPRYDECAGKTYPELNELFKGKCIAVPGETCEKLAQNILAAMNGQGIFGGGTTTGQSTGGSAVLIPDKTFYGLIKQILGAIDGVFIIANNMAYLFSFKDFYNYRDLYEEYIPEIKVSDIIIDSVTHNWTTQGCYNAVEVTYSDGIVKYQHDALVELYGESVFYYEFLSDDEETAKSKAKALLSAHIRDYSLDLELNCLYNPNITVGGWVKIPKTLVNLSFNNYDQNTLKKIYKTSEERKRKGVKITNINEITQLVDDENKNIQHIITEDKEEYDIEVEKKDYEIYFVQGYKLRWTPEIAPIMHLHLKYGPDTPEDPVNATIGTGSVSTSGNAQFGNDCFYVCEIMPNNNACINDDHYLAEGDLHKSGFEPQEQHLRSRCKQGSNLAKDMAGKTPQEVYAHIRSKFGYCLYADSSSLWPCVSDMYDQACGANCGDTTRLLKCGLDAIGIKNWGVHINGHYFNALELDGKWVAIDGTGSYDYSNTAGFPIPGKPSDCCEPGQQEHADTC